MSYAKNRVPRLRVGRIDGQVWLRHLARIPLEDRLQLPVWFVVMSSRVEAMAEAAGWKTIGEMVRHPESNISRRRNMGKKAISELKADLALAGLNLGMYFEPKYRDWQ